MALNRARKISLLLLVVFLSAGIWLGVNVLEWTRTAARSSSWPVTDGVVLESEYKPAIGKVPGKRIFYYQYRVGHQVYVGSKIGFGTDQFPQPGIRERVRVSWDPGAPEISVLHPGLRHLDYAPVYALLLVIAIACAGAGLNAFPPRRRCCGSVETPA